MRSALITVIAGNSMRTQGEAEISITLLGVISVITYLFRGDDDIDSAAIASAKAQPGHHHLDPNSLSPGSDPTSKNYMSY